MATPVVEALDAGSTGRRARWSWLTDRVVADGLLVADMVVVAAAGLLAGRTATGAGIGGVEIYAIATGVILTAQAFEPARLRTPAPGGAIAIRPLLVLALWTLIVATVVALGEVAGALSALSRWWALLWFGYGLLGLLTIRGVAKVSLARCWRAGRLRQKVAIVGAAPQASHLLRALRAADDRSVEVVGQFDDRLHDAPALPAEGTGTLQDLLDLARTGAISQVVVALPWSDGARLAACVRHLRGIPAEVSVYPAAGDPCLGPRSITAIGDLKLLRLTRMPLTGRRYLLKAFEDRTIAAVALALAMPLMLLIAILIRLDSPGPVLFRQKRFGFNNQTIEVLKFRTMHPQPEPADGQWLVQASRDDGRVARVGRILRQTSLDELPQLINVLRGEMSIVGPRPHALAHHEHYARLIDDYLSRHRVKPGITGWAQVNGLRGETRTLDQMRQRVAHDLYYIENWSLGLDVRIILRTVIVGFVHPNAY